MPRRKGQTFKPRALSREQINEVIAKLPFIRDKALVALTFLLGARISEVLNVKVSDITKEGDFLIFDTIVKKRKEQIMRKVPVPLEDPLARYVVEWLEYVKEGKLFDITPQRAWQIMKKVGISPHELRHSRITELAPYVSAVSLSKFAGWRIKGLGEIERYVHLRYEDYIEPLRKIALKASQI